MKALYIALLIFLLPFTLFAQWEWQNPIPTSNSLYGINFLNDSIAFCVGDGGFLMKSTDTGLTWESINSNITLFLYDICFIDEYNFIAAGYGGTIVKSSDGGISWQTINSGAGSVLYDIFFINQNVGWICGKGYILKTTDGGISWDIIFDFLSYSPNYKIHFFDLNNGLLLSKGNVLHSTTDGGFSWEFISTGFTGFRNMFVHSTMEIVIIGENGLIIKTTDGGSTWSEKYTGTNKSLRSIDFNDENNGIVVGVDGIILITSDDGETWVNISNQYDDFTDLYSTNTNSNGIVLAVGRTGKLLRSTDCGITWESIRQGYINDLNSIYMLNKMEGWIVGNEGLILRTTSGGDKWEVADSITNVNLYDILFITDSIGWIVGDAGNVYKTYNRGQTWELVDQFGNIKIYSIFFIDENTGWVAGGNGSIFKTTNGGILWWQQITGTSKDLISIFFSNENNGWCTQSGAIDPILYTTDGGYIWQSTIGAYGILYSIYFTDTLTGWIVGVWPTNDPEDFGVVVKTTDGGLTWQSDSYPWGYLFHDVHFLDPERGWIFGRISSNGGNHREGVIAYTTDGGENFIFQKSNTANSLLSASIINETKIWVVGKYGTILKNDSAYIVTQLIEERINIAHDFSLSQNYPNPFNPTTKIRFTISDVRFTILKVYDILGREVATLVNEEKPAGSYEVEFNSHSGKVRNLTSGIYYYQLSAGDYIETKKMVLVK